MPQCSRWLIAPIALVALLGIGNAAQRPLGDFRLSGPPTISPAHASARSAETAGPVDLHIATEAADAFEHGMGAWDVQWGRDKQGVILDDRLLIEDDGPGTRGIQSRSVAQAAALRGDTARREGARQETPPRGSPSCAGGKALPLVLFMGRTSPGDLQRHPAGGRREYLRIVPPELLRQGDNEVMLAPNKGDEFVLLSRRSDILANAPDRKDRPPRSFRSTDGGQSWQAVDGEYRVRLPLLRYREKGHFISPVIYLGEASGKLREVVEGAQSEFEALVKLPPGSTGNGGTIRRWNVIRPGTRTTSSNTRPASAFSTPSCTPSAVSRWDTKRDSSSDTTRAVPDQATRSMKSGRTS